MAHREETEFNIVKNDTRELHGGNYPKAKGIQCDEEEQTVWR